ncbi:unnamed protein product [Linum trigynum]|uniref:Uncharacterized protein n=1 Tax=Linum trigynum TaxID=586398 RepID=A0AAV2ESG9_9ROSI
MPAAARPSEEPNRQHEFALDGGSIFRSQRLAIVKSVNRKRRAVMHRRGAPKVSLGTPPALAQPPVTSLEGKCGKEKEMTEKGSNLKRKKQGAQGLIIIIIQHLQKFEIHGSKTKSIQ